MNHYYVLKTQRAVMGQHGFEYYALLPQHKYNVRGPFASDDDANTFMVEKGWGNTIYESELSNKHEALEEYKRKEEDGLLGYNREHLNRYEYRPAVLGGVG